jgi:hypothetical protein
MDMLFPLLEQRARSLFSGISLTVWLLCSPTGSIVPERFKGKKSYSLEER